MDELLILVDDELTINPHLLSIDVINTIWKRDKGSSQKSQITQKNERVKHTARKELSWIWYMESWRSIYQRYPDRLVRAEKVKAKLGFPADWKEDDSLKAAREWWVQEQEETNIDIVAVRSSKKALDTITTFLDTVTLTGAANLNRSGSAIFKPKDISAGIKDLVSTREAVKKLEEDVRTATMTSSNKRVRGGGETGRYEL